MTVAYDPPLKGWDGYAAPGAAALQAAILGLEDLPSATNLGVVRDKSRCGPGDPRSRHCKTGYGAAAGDVGFPKSHPEGTWVATLLYTHRVALGIQGINWDGRRWGFGTDAWRAITSGDPHDTHVHWELNDDAAQHLTYEVAFKVLTPEEDDLPYTQEQLTAYATAGALTALNSAQGHQEIRDAINEGLENADSTLSNRLEHVVRRVLEKELADGQSVTRQELAEIVRNNSGV